MERQKPTVGVKIASVFFMITGIILLLGFIKSVLDVPAGQRDPHIFLVYIFLVAVCFFVSFGLYRHKKWALYVAYAMLLYLIVNFILNLSSNFMIDIAVTGIPLLVIVGVVTFLLWRKHHHFIH